MNNSDIALAPMDDDGKGNDDDDGGVGAAVTLLPSKGTLEALADNVISIMTELSDDDDDDDCTMSVTLSDHDGLVFDDDDDDGGDFVLNHKKRKACSNSSMSVNTSDGSGVMHFNMHSTPSAVSHRISLDNLLSDNMVSPRFFGALRKLSVQHNGVGGGNGGNNKVRRHDDKQYTSVRHRDSVENLFLCLKDDPSSSSSDGNDSQNDDIDRGKRMSDLKRNSVVDLLDIERKDESNNSDSHVGNGKILLMECASQKDYKNGQNHVYRRIRRKSDASSAEENISMTGSLNIDCELMN